MLGGALEARRGRGEHTAEEARRLTGKGLRPPCLLTGGTWMMMRSWPSS